MNNTLEKLKLVAQQFSTRLNQSEVKQKKQHFIALNSQNRPL